MSAPHIPQDVELLAIRLAQEEAIRTAEARTLEGAEAIADRLRDEAAAQGLHVKEYIETLTKDAQGVQPPEGTSPTSAFWSFGIEDERAPKGWLDNRYIAEAWAKLQNVQQPGSAQTLETSAAGRRLNEMHLWETEVLDALGGSQEGFTTDWTRQCWGDLSETYAAAAKGPVVVFAQYADTRSILYNRELPTLHPNENVGLDNIHFAYEAPQPWPKETRAEVGTDAARAQLQYNDPTKAHYVDPKTYPDQDPTARKAALESEFASVTAERSERAAEKKAEQTTGKAAEAEQTQQEGKAEQAEQDAPAPSAAVPLWQVGFTPKPVLIETGSSGPGAASTAPPTPDLQKQTTGPGLG